MNRQDIIRKLKAAEPDLRAHGAAGLFLFGSRARGTARKTSDVDLFIDKDPERKFGFDEFMTIYEVIQRRLGKKTQIGYSTRDGLAPYIRNEVEKDAVRIF
jgi:uncharacterized protein